MANEENQEMEQSFSDTDPDELLTRMKTMNKKFRNSCSQVILLNNQIEYLQARYDRAVRANKRSYRYFLRLRLATLEGIRNMFYEYACRRADELDTMQDRLVQEGIIDSDFDLEDSDNEQTPQGHGRGDDSFESSHVQREQEETTLDIGFQNENIPHEHCEIISQENVPEIGSEQVYITQTADNTVNNQNENYFENTSENSHPPHYESGISESVEQDIVIEGALDTVVIDTQSALDSIDMDTPSTVSTVVMDIPSALDTVVTDTPTDHSYADIVSDKQNNSACSQNSEEPMQS